MSTFKQLSRSVNTKTTKADGSRIPPPCHIVTIPQGPPTMRQHCRQPRRGIIHVPPVLSSVSMLLQPPTPHPPPTLPSTAPFNLLERVAPRTMDTLPQCPSTRKYFWRKIYSIITETLRLLWQPCKFDYHAPALHEMRIHWCIHQF